MFRPIRTLFNLAILIAGLAFLSHYLPLASERWAVMEESIHAITNP